MNWIALFANDVTHYHEYALGSYPGASRTNYSPKWLLAIRMRCRCYAKKTFLALLLSTLNSTNIVSINCEDGWHVGNKEIGEENRIARKISIMK